MKILDIEITKFRHLNDIKIDLGERLTAISGQNGTGKSTILGLLGHVCREKSGFKTFDDKGFETEYSEIFRFSYPDFDKPKEHIYEINFSDGTSTQIVSYARKELNKPESLRLRVGKSTKEGGKIDFPVIFLGLKRLYPLAQEKSFNSLAHHLSTDELDFYIKSHNSILLLDDAINTEEIVSSNKHFLAVKSQNYNALGNSAGQDNIGQIITAIISFQRLKTNLGKQYPGGILLIDELEATLFPAAQEKLIDFLFKVSSKLDLQVVFTTHSIEILEILLTTKYRYQAKVCYFHKANGPIEKAEETKLSEIIADLKAKVLFEKVKDLKIDLYLEDQQAEQFLKALLNSKLKKSINFIKAQFGAEELLNLANKKIPAFNKSIILLDGDKLRSVRKPKPQNVLFLPGSDSPEKIIFNYLKSLKSNHPFWGGFAGYTKQICFRDLQDLSDRVEMKKWWNEQIKYWGIGGRKLFKYWKSENLVIVEIFNKEFEKVLLKLFRKIYQE